MRRLIVLLTTALITTSGFGTTINQIGTYNNWETANWTAIGGYDADNGATENLDFVGNVLNPGLYYANNGSYVFFRMRVDADTFGTASGAHCLLIDIAGYGITGIDYAFAWDSKSNNNLSHGLEMSIAAANGPTWGVSQLDDLDGNNAKKGTVDINGDGRTTDGYVRTMDGQITDIFGNTSFIDFAVSWSYLETYTNLRSNQTWSVGAASIANATDHNAFNADIMGANLTDSISIGWVPTAAIPEPAVISLIAVAGLFSLLGRRVFDFLRTR